MVWNNDCVPNTVLPSPRGYGWTMENYEWIPVVTTLSPVPEAIIQLVKCRCAKERWQRRITVSAPKQGSYTRTSAAVPRMMIMDVTINKANKTMMTEILRKKKMMTMR